MLDMGFIDDVTAIARKTPASRQTLLFSATVDQRINKVIANLLKNPTQIDVRSEKKAGANIKQKLYFC